MNRSLLSLQTPLGPRRIAAYFRTAISDPASISRQRMACLAETHRLVGGVSEPRLYLDLGEPAMRWERPGLQALMCDIKAGLVDALVIQDFARLSRSPSGLCRILDVAEGHGVEVMTLSLRLSTASEVWRAWLGPAMRSFAGFERGRGLVCDAGQPKEEVSHAG